jgi:hypothetical protein
MRRRYHAVVRTVNAGRRRYNFCLGHLRAGVELPRSGIDRMNRIYRMDDIAIASTQSG